MVFVDIKAEMMTPAVLEISVLLALASSAPVEVPLYHQVIDEWLTLPDLTETKLHEQDEYYVANIGLGTPGRYQSLFIHLTLCVLVQTFNLTIYSDTFWTFVLDKNFKQMPCYEAPGLRHKFDTRYPFGDRLCYLKNHF